MIGYQLDHISQRATGFGQDGPQILKSLARLFLEATARLAILIDANLAGKPDRVVDPNGLRKLPGVIDFLGAGRINQNPSLRSFY